jgi:hypothetical protein
MTQMMEGAAQHFHGQYFAIFFPKSPNSASRLKAIQIDEQDGEEFLDEVKSDMRKATPDR